MTTHFKAKGVGAVIGGSQIHFGIGSTITDGLKASVGRPIEIDLEDEGLVFLLSCLAQSHPHILQALAYEMDKCDCEYGPPPEREVGGYRRYDRFETQRYARYRGAIRGAMEASVLTLEVP